MFPVEVQLALHEELGPPVGCTVHRLPAEVDDLCGGNEVHRPADLLHAIAPVELLAVDEEALVEPTDLGDHVASNHHAGAVDPARPHAPRRGLTTTRIAGSANGGSPHPVELGVVESVR